MEITEKVAYLKGLMEGLDIDKSSKEGKLFAAMLDILDDVAISVSDLESGMTMVTHQVDVLDEFLLELQEEFEELSDDDHHCSCGCEDDDFDDDYDDDGELYEITCPKCNDKVFVDEDMLDEGEIACPGCGENLEFDLDGILDGCDC